MTLGNVDISQGSDVLGGAESGIRIDNSCMLFESGRQAAIAGRFHDAIVYCCRSIQTGNHEPHMRRAYSILVHSYRELGSLKAALYTCRQAQMRFHADEEFLFHEAVILHALGQLDYAEELFRILGMPEDVFGLHARAVRHGDKALHNLAIIYEQTGRFDQAASVWSILVRSDTSNWAAWMGWFDALSAKRDEAELERLASGNLETRIGDDVRAVATARLSLLRHARADAIAGLEMAYLRRHSLEVLRELCATAFHGGNFIAAEAALIELTNRNHQDASAFLNLAASQLKRGKAIQAAESAMRSLRLRVGNSSAERVYEDAVRLSSGGEPTNRAGSALSTHTPFALSTSDKCDIWIGRSLIGDALLCEPALRFLAQARGRRLTVALDGIAQELFRDNPYISVQACKTMDSTAEGCIRLEPMVAAGLACRLRQHMCGGFLALVGLDPRKFNCRPRLYGDDLGSHRRPAKVFRNGRIAVAPFSASCSVHTSGVPNKTIELSWWKELIRNLPLPVDSFGAAEEPLLDGSSNHRGRSLREVAKMLQYCELLITGDTGLAHFAGAVDCDMVLLLSSACSLQLTGPRTGGRLEVIESALPPRWTHQEVLAGVKRILAY